MDAIPAGKQRLYVSLPTDLHTIDDPDDVYIWYWMNSGMSQWSHSDTAPTDALQRTGQDACGNYYWDLDALPADGFLVRTQTSAHANQESNICPMKHLWCRYGSQFQRCVSRQLMNHFGL